MNSSRSLIQGHLLSTAQKAANEAGQARQDYQSGSCRGYRADRIYAGQLAVLANTPVGPTIKHMWEQENEHLAAFNKYIPQYRARPTDLLPFWHVAGYALGAATALTGKESAMACTVAVEATHHETLQLTD